MNVAAILTALLDIAPQVFALVQKQAAGGTVTDADVQALFTAYGVEANIAAALIAKMGA